MLLSRSSSWPLYMAYRRQVVAGTGTDPDGKVENDLRSSPANGTGFSITIR